MPSYLTRLAARRRELVARSQAQRAQLDDSVRAVRGAFKLGPIGRAVLDGVHRHPGLAIGATVALVVLGRHRLYRLTARSGRALALSLRAAPLISTAACLATARRTRAARH